VSELGNGPEKMLGHLEKDPALVDAYVEFSMTDHKWAWRATWVVHHFSNKHANQINKYADQYIEMLSKTERDGHLREIISILINLNLSEEQEGELFDICYELIQSNKRQSSVRGISFRYMMRLAGRYPELKEELKIIFENIKDYISPGIRNGIEMRLNNEILTK
jgi:argonaute-like protein implicated in RNA metabolism and viral defense